MVKNINELEFNELVINAKGDIFVDFYADWCGPCKMMSPIMDEVAKTEVVYKINTDLEPQLSQNYGIMSIPCIIHFKDGKEVNRSVGLVDKEKILGMKD